MSGRYRMSGAPDVRSSWSRSSVLYPENNFHHRMSGGHRMSGPPDVRCLQRPLSGNRSGDIFPDRMSGPYRMSGPSPHFLTPSPRDAFRVFNSQYRTSPVLIIRQPGNLPDYHILHFHYSFARTSRMTLIPRPQLLPSFVPRSRHRPRSSSSGNT